MQKACSVGQGPKSVSAPADGGQQSVNGESAFGPSRPAAPTTQWTQDLLSLYQMEFGAYSLLAVGHGISVYMCVSVCLWVHTHTCVSVCLLHLSTHLTSCCFLAFHSALIKLPVSTWKQLSISWRSELHQSSLHLCDPVLSVCPVSSLFLKLFSLFMSLLKLIWRSCLAVWDKTSSPNRDYWFFCCSFLSCLIYLIISFCCHYYFSSTSHFTLLIWFFSLQLKSKW